MADTPRRWAIAPELGVAALVAAASAPLARLFAPDGVYGDVFAAIASSLTIGWAARRLRIPIVVAWALSVLGMLWFIVFRFAPDTMWAIFPTLTSLHEIGLAVRAGAQQVMQEVAPVEPTGPLLMFVVAGVWMTCWLASTAVTALQNPVLAAASAVPLFILPGSLVSSTRLWFESAVFLAGAGWILFADQRERAERWAPPGRVHSRGWRVGPAVRVAALVAVAVALLTPALPGFGGPPILRTRGPGARIYFNPLVAIKPTLDSDEVRVLFAVRTQRPTYYRLTSLDEFDGKVWKQRERTSLSDVGPTGALPGATVSSDIVRQDIDIIALAGPWLPAAYDPFQIAAPGGRRLRLDTDTRAIIRESGLQQGISYTVYSALNEPPQGTVDVPFVYAEGEMARYRALPRGLPREVRRIAERVTRTASTPFRKAIALQNYLRTFRYDEKVAAGHSFDTILEFLTETKRGYCEQFAGTMGVLARSLGMPSRVAIGFGLGDTRGPVYEVTTEQAHAWVEIWFPQAGWIAFEPTPRAGVARVPTYADSAPTGEPSAGPSVAPTPTTSDGPVPIPSRAPAGEAEIGTGGARGGVPGWIMALAVLATPFAALGVFVGLSTLRRRRRFARAQTPQESVVVRYADFLEWCAGAGMARARGETPVEHARRLAAVTASAEAPLTTLATVVDEALWALPNGLDERRADVAAEDARRAISVTLSRRARLWALLRLPRLPR